MTHHWCFRSTVAQTQIRLAVRAWISAEAFAVLTPESSGSVGSRDIGIVGAFLRALHGDPYFAPGQMVPALRDSLASDVYSDLVRFDVVDALYRPLAEGLAQFAEYDAVSRLQSKMFSPIPMAIAWNFAGRDRLERAGMVFLKMDDRWVHPWTLMHVANQLLANAH